MAVTTNSCKRIELAYLKKSKMLVKGQVISSSLSWTCGSSIKITTYYTEEDKYLKLDYIINNDYKVAYRIHLAVRPSNLGKGEVLYMVCPFSGSLSRKLYMAYGSTQFKSMGAYNNRIYYRGQLSSSKNYNDKYWNLLNQLESKPTKRNQTHYNGLPTKRYLREIELEDKLDYFDHKRFLQLFQGSIFR
jgi:hypothetical protein